MQAGAGLPQAHGIEWGGHCATLCAVLVRGLLAKIVNCCFPQASQLDSFSYEDSADRAARLQARLRERAAAQEAAQARRGELLWRVAPRGGELIELPWEAEPPSDGDDGDGGGEDARGPKRRRRAEPGALAEYVCWSTGERIDRHCYVLDTS